MFTLNVRSDCEKNSFKELNNVTVTSNYLEITLTLTLSTLNISLNPGNSNGVYKVTGALNMQDSHSGNTDGDSFAQRYN